MGIRDIGGNDDILANKEVQVISIRTFRIRFPEFIDTEDVRIQMAINDAVDMHMGKNEQRWGGIYDRALAYLAAHLLTTGNSDRLGDTSVKSGRVSSKTAGGVSVGYAVVAKDYGISEEFFMSSSYGQQFMLMLRRCFVGIMVAR